MNSLLLTNNAVLTHSASTATNTHKLEIDVAGTVLVSTNSRIGVSGKGYLPGRTTGNTTQGASAAVWGGAGASYGGLGYSSAGVANAV